MRPGAIKRVGVNAVLRVRFFASGLRGIAQDGWLSENVVTQVISGIYAIECAMIGGMDSKVKQHPSANAALARQALAEFDLPEGAHCEVDDSGGVRIYMNGKLLGAITSDEALRQGVEMAILDELRIDSPLLSDDAPAEWGTAALRKTAARIKRERSAGLSPSNRLLKHVQEAILSADAKYENLGR